MKENGVPEPQDAKTPETEAVNGDEKTNDTTTTEKPVENGEKIEETPESKKSKEKTKKKKWSFRSISFSRKDKSKPNREAEKNGEVKEVAEEVSYFILSVCTTRYNDHECKSLTKTKLYKVLSM